MVPDGTQYKGKFMYKKITHNITEEHFGHPVATQIKKVVDKDHKHVVKPKWMPMSPSAFIQTVDNYWTNYLDKMNQVITQVGGTEQDLISVEDGLFNGIDGLGTALKQYYGTEFGERMISQTRMLALTMISIIRAIRDHQDTKNMLNNRIYNLVANDMGQYMQSANNSWNFNMVKKMISDLADAWVAQAKAVQNKDGVAQNASKDAARKLAHGFASILSDGIIAQHPEKFLAP